MTEDRALDVAVAIHVMGWPVCEKTINECGGCGSIVTRTHRGYEINPPGWDSEEPWTALSWPGLGAVVEKMRGRHAYPISIEVDRYGGTYSGGEWVAAFNCYTGGAFGSDTEAMDFWADPPKGVAAADSAPRAVAIAALRALGVEVPG